MNLEEKMDKGTIIRSGVLVLALINQALLALGLNPIPGSEDAWGEVISTGITIIVAAVAWFKNNYLTATGKKQKSELKKKGLTKAK